MMKKAFLLLVTIISLLQVLQAQSIRGFSQPALQHHLEQQFMSGIRADSIEFMLKTLSARQHHLGSPGSKAVAEQVLRWMKAWGLEARIETYKVLFPTPKTRLLEMTGPTRFVAGLKEAVMQGDDYTAQQDLLPTYNAWSADGDVTAPLVFVNYGIPADYEMLDRMGISVKGKIVIAKYGKSWRGIKPKVAQEHGAVGCLIYSDPDDDGYHAGDVYPTGAFKHETGVQRGSVMDMPIYPGDPLTPNVGATASASRLDRKEAPNLLKIPVLPISYQDAQPLLAALKGPVAPRDWQGGLPFTYHVGPGETTVHLKLAFNWDLVDCHNVIGTIKGSEYPDEWVIRGNHHDAWVHGANDPISGLSALLEEARVLGSMAKTGWRPRRTMMFCAWDGEEPGLLGSTEWVEDHAAELSAKCVAYINSDASGRGYLSAGGSHALETFMDEIAKSVPDPQTGVNVFKRLKALEVMTAKTPGAQQSAMNKKQLTLDALGSGSDYSSFLQHLGITTLDLGFGGENRGGEYHTNFDTYNHYIRFKDPGLAYGAALSKVAGLSALRLANADILPYNFERLYATVEGYVEDLITSTNQLRQTIQIQNKMLEEGIYVVTQNPTEKLAAPPAKAPVPYIDFSPVQNALTSLSAITKQLNTLLNLPTTSPVMTDQLNKTLYHAEQQLLSPEGLPRRGWYRHTLYAPGFYTGYGVKTLPGVREPIEQGQYAEAQQQVTVLADAINRLAAHLSKALQ